MRALQLWLSSCDVSRAWSSLIWDMQRAFAEYDGESTIWFLPWVDEVVRWEDPTIPRQEMALPAQYFNRVVIYHIGENRRVFGLGARQYFPSGRVDEDFLDSWLHMCEVGPVLTDRLPEAILLPELPVIRDHEFVGYVQAVVYREWDSSNQSAFYPPEPWAALFPFGVRQERLDELSFMVELARRNRDDLAGALRHASAASHLCISEGFTRQVRAWVIPIWLEEGVDGVIDAMQRFNFNQTIRTGAEALISPEWWNMVTQPIAIRRVWGLFGLLWALLLERLELKRSFSLCERCQRLLPGARKRRFCSQAENKKCFNERRLEDKYRSLGHKNRPTGKQV
jgi:hypothetical protein